MGLEIPGETMLVNHQFSAFRESDIGECSVGAVMDSLVLDLKEIPSSLTIPIFQGRTDISREVSSDSMHQDAFAHRVGSRDSTGKGFSWSRGLGCEISPINTRSARK